MMSVTGVIITLTCFLLVTSESLLNQTQTVSPANLTSVAAEGGPVKLPTNDTTHMGREHMIKVTSVQHLNETFVPKPVDHMIKVNQSKTPAYEMAQKNDNKTSVPRKDAILSHDAIHINSSSTTEVPHKPTMTIGEDDEPPKSKSTSNQTQKNGLSIEAVTQKKRKTDYVVPIVAVILSVPLVAIIFSILYKRGSDWWQHRHYRRMDFLIEGMYNN